MLYPAAVDVFTAATGNADDKEEETGAVSVAVRTHYASVFSGLFASCVYGGQVTKLKRQDINTSILRRSQALFQQFRSRHTTNTSASANASAKGAASSKDRNMKIVKMHQTTPEVAGNIQVVSPASASSTDAGLYVAITNATNTTTVTGVVSPVSMELESGNRSATTPSNPNIPSFEPLVVCIDHAESVHFLHTTLAHLPFEYYDDPLYLIYTINRNIPYQTTVYVNEMKNILNGKWVVGEAQKSLAVALEGFVECVSERVEGAMQPPVLGTNRGKMNMSMNVNTNTHANPKAQKSNWSQGLVVNESKFDQFVKNLCLSGQHVPLLVEFFACVALECRTLEVTTIHSRRPLQRVVVTQ